MAPTVLIKFFGLIVHSRPKNMVLSTFPEKIPETEKNIFYFSVWPSPNGAPNPNDQSRLNSISWVPLQIFPALFFFFDLPSKLNLVHIRKKF